MRTYFHHYHQNNFRPMRNHCCNMNFSTSIFGNIGNLGCGMGNSFLPNFGFGGGFGFGFGFSMGMNFGNFFGGIINPFFTFSRSPFMGFMNNFSLPFGRLFSLTRNRNNSQQLQSSNDKSVNNNSSLHTKKNYKDKNIDKNNSVQNKNNDNSTVLAKKEDSLKDLPKEILNEMQFIGKDALKKFLKNGDFKISDLLIERVPAKITSIDFSGIYNLKSGTKNDYRNENGDIVRIADGTKVVIKFSYKGKNYESVLESHKTPKKNEALSYIEKK